MLYIHQLGGATAQIGDPSGKSKERAPVNMKTIEKNLESIHSSIETIFSNHERYLWKSQEQLLALRCFPYFFQLVLFWFFFWSNE